MLFASSVLSLLDLPTNTFTARRALAATLMSIKIGKSCNVGNHIGLQRKDFILNKKCLQHNTTNRNQNIPACS